MIRQVRISDAESIAEIYNYYVLNSIVTFEEEIVTTEEMADRIQAATAGKSEGADNLPWLVAELDGEVIGYSYATKWKERVSYQFSVEVTVYLTPALKSQGWGTRLYSALLSELNHYSPKINAVLGGISLPNEASIALHEKFGMKKVAHFKEIGFKFNRWIDTGYWQKILNNHI
ncbi:MAG: N-acetyltransferase family protein [Alteromonadaceae bacterium]|nr:N-acetyltransferase family protein [Alteromonadaceae bacterium]